MTAPDAIDWVADEWAVWGAPAGESPSDEAPSAEPVNPVESTSAPESASESALAVLAPHDVGAEDIAPAPDAIAAEAITEGSETASPDDGPAASPAATSDVAPARESEPDSVAACPPVLEVEPIPSGEAAQVEAPTSDAADEAIARSTGVEETALADLATDAALPLASREEPDCPTSPDAPACEQVGKADPLADASTYFALPPAAASASRPTLEQRLREGFDPAPDADLETPQWHRQVWEALEPPAPPPQVERDALLPPLATAVAPPLQERARDQPSQEAEPPAVSPTAQKEATLTVGEPPPTLRDRLTRLARFAVRCVAVYLAVVVGLIFVYRVVDPPASTLMIYEGLFGAGVERTWVPIESISPHLVRAVVVSEDGRFCSHHGIDVEAIQEAIARSRGGIPRGASTISMQVVKNLFLWQSKSYVRKLIELPLTLLMELVWPKSRVLEVYLNIAEWAPGVFGAEAAARHHFNKSAASLTEREAAQLAASLPNPLVRDAGDPGPRVKRKAGIIQARVRASGGLAECVLRGL